MSLYPPQNSSSESEEWEDEYSGDESLDDSFSDSSCRTQEYRSRSNSLDSNSSSASDDELDYNTLDHGSLDQIPFLHDQFEIHRGYRQNRRSRGEDDSAPSCPQKRTRLGCHGIELNHQPSDMVGRSDLRSNARNLRSDSSSRVEGLSSSNSSTDRRNSKQDDDWRKALEPAQTRVCEGGVKVAMRSFEHCHQFFVERLSALKGDELVVEGPLTLKLFDPVSLCRLETPCRGHLCQHMEAFELCTYSRLNTSELEDPEIVEMPKCPICEMEIPPSCLVVDTLILRLLRATNSREVELSVGDLPGSDNAKEKDVIIAEKAVFWSSPQGTHSNQVRVEISIGSDGEDDCVVVESKAPPSRADRLQMIKDLAPVQIEPPFVKTHRTYIPGDYFKSLEDERKHNQMQQMRLTVMLTVLNSGSRNVLVGLGLREGVVDSLVSKRPFRALDKEGMKKSIMEIQGVDKPAAEHFWGKLEKLIDKILDSKSRSNRAMRNWTTAGSAGLAPSSGMVSSSTRSHPLPPNHPAAAYWPPHMNLNSACWNFGSIQVGPGLGQRPGPGTGQGQGQGQGGQSQGNNSTNAGQPRDGDQIASMRASRGVRSSTNAGQPRDGDQIASMRASRGVRSSTNAGQPRDGDQIASMRASRGVRSSTNAGQPRDGDQIASMRASRGVRSTNSRGTKRGSSSDSNRPNTRSSDPAPPFLNAGGPGYLHAGQCTYNFLAQSAVPMPMYSMRASRRVVGNGPVMPRASHLSLQGTVLAFGDQNVNVFMQPQGWTRSAKESGSASDPPSGSSRDAHRNEAPMNAPVDPSSTPASAFARPNVNQQASPGAPCQAPPSGLSTSDAGEGGAAKESLSHGDDSFSNFWSLWNPVTSEDLSVNTLQFDSGEDVF